MADQLCVIVGAGPNLSQAVARRFGREGFRIAQVARRAEALATYTEELNASGIEARGFVGDGGDVETLANTFAAIKSLMGSIDVLVYNAAVIQPGTPTTLSAEKLTTDFQVNVVGALVATQQVIAEMQVRGHGTILLTGGGLALNPRPEYASLAIGKAGLRSLAYSLGAELEPLGIHVATVTIAGSVQPGTHFDPDVIAERYWELHAQPVGNWEREIIYR